MPPLKELRLCCVVALLVLCGLAAYDVHARPGTDVIGNAVSPDGKWDAVLVVRDAGAVTDYATVVSLNADNWFARQLAVFWPAAVFAADDNSGAVSTGDRGHIDVRMSWSSDTQLIVTYPEKARAFKQEPKIGSVSIVYIPSRTVELRPRK